MIFAIIAFSLYVNTQVLHILFKFFKFFNNEIIQALRSCKKKKKKNDQLVQLCAYFPYFFCANQFFYNKGNDERLRKFLPSHPVLCFSCLSKDEGTTPSFVQLLVDSVNGFTDEFGNFNNIGKINIILSGSNFCFKQRHKLHSTHLMGRPLSAKSESN